MSNKEKKRRSSNNPKKKKKKTTIQFLRRRLVNLLVAFIIGYMLFAFVDTIMYIYPHLLYFLFLGFFLYLGVELIDSIRRKREEKKRK